MVTTANRCNYRIWIIYLKKDLKKIFKAFSALVFFSYGVRNHILKTSLLLRLKCFVNHPFNPPSNYTFTFGRILLITLKRDSFRMIVLIVWSAALCVFDFSELVADNFGKRFSSGFIYHSVDWILFILFHIQLYGLQNTYVSYFTEYVCKLVYSVNSKCLSSCSVTF